MITDKYQYNNYQAIFVFSFIQNGVQDGRQHLVKFIKLCKLVNFMSSFIPLRVNLDHPQIIFNPFNPLTEWGVILRHAQCTL